MGTYVTTADVRKITGAPTALISDEDIEGLITIIENKTPGYFNISFSPRTELFFGKVYDLDDIELNKDFVNTIQKIEVNETDETLTDWAFNEGINKLQRRDVYNKEYGSEFKYAYNTKDDMNDVKVKYTYSILKGNGTNTESSTPVVAGTSVAISVDSDSGFTKDSYIRIKGFDGNNEVAKISTTPAANSLTVDKLYYEHETDSVIEELDIPQILKDFMLYEVATSVAINAVGGTYTIATSYNFPEYSVVKGVPYPHWEKSSNANQKERDRLEKEVWALLAIVG